MKPPTIKVEIIHIDGPLKGTIHEFYDQLIAIGRHPDCHVCFPKDLTTISRKHAEIRRDGNRFKIVDLSTNGTLVNGKLIQESYLKDGDVMTISENGPKISLISTVLSDKDLPANDSKPIYNEPVIDTPEPITPVKESPALSTRKFYPEDPDEPSVQINTFPQEPPVHHVTSSDSQSPEPVIKTTRNPFVIQFGAMLKTFDTLPITLGSSPDCNFVINHPSVLAQHAQIFFFDQNYCIKDLTGQSILSVNGRPVTNATPLLPETHVSLSTKGPFFQFLGEGRLAEVEDPSGHHLNLQNNNSNEEVSERGQEKKEKSFWPFKK